MFNILKNILKIFIVILSFPLGILLKLISYSKKIVIINQLPNALGNFICLIEFLLYDKKKEKFIIFYLDENLDNRACNTFIYKKFRYLFEEYIFLKNTSLYKFIIFLNKYYKFAEIGLSGCNSTFENKLNNYTSFTFTQQEEIVGIEYLNKINIYNKKDKNKPFVCLHNRDSAFYKHKKIWTEVSRTRNSDIQSYKKFILYLSDKNISSVRLGKTVENKLNISISNYISYAESKDRNDFLDVYLLSKCNFFVGNLTGVLNLASFFGKPIVLVNTPNPSPVDMLQLTKNSLFLPKLCYSNKEQRYLTLSEEIKIFGSTSGGSELDKLKKYDLKFIDNTQEDIMEAVKEMLEFLNYNIILENIELNKKYWDIVSQKSEVIVNGLAIGGEVDNYISRARFDLNIKIPQYFLENNRWWLK